ncbi:hypothetical protein HGM15179_018581 [Zosterops borbonicus]|uniref:Uncharacterized protein n=1 Tax=Zosterops borbonicus TaxID=364589 RepID=A0A8K1DC45_9PASS|nr:hypothetical protein HGM15179_018581 [Zosterops borbonicus]
MPSHSFCEELLPNVQPKPPLAQLKTVSSCPVACCLGEESNPHLATTFQVVVESDMVSPEPPFLQAKQLQLPQLLLIELVFQALHQPCCLSLDTFENLNILLKLSGLELDIVLKVWPHQCQIHGKNHFRSPSGHTIPDTGQDAIGLLGHLGTLLSHIQSAINQYL